jgi:hypothetical protein
MCPWSACSAECGASRREAGNEPGIATLPPVRLAAGPTVVNHYAASAAAGTIDLIAALHLG